jgi:glycosyltransferase involved in cell wall biosynthesis
MSTNNGNLIKLLVVSHVTHYKYRGCLYAYGPYAREIGIWADLFPTLLIAAPCRNEAPPKDVAAFSCSNICIVPQAQTGGTSFSDRVRQLLTLPLLVYTLSRAMRGADAIHVRCPGNLGLLGAILAPLFSRKLVAKYAGQWNGYTGEALTVKLQRRILKSFWWRGPVTVYGEWPDQPSHIVPFFTSVLTETQLDLAREAARRKRFGNLLQVVFVGRLTRAKNVHVLLAAIAKLKEEGIGLHCTIVGEGPERANLDVQVSNCGLGSCVKFTGALDFERVLDQYGQADVLVLASESEGWPKAIAEGMAFGLVCVGSNRGLVPWMLGEGRGYLAEPGDVNSLAEALRKIVTSPHECREISSRAAVWAQQFSLEGLGRALRELLSKSWGMSFDA